MTTILIVDDEPGVRDLLRDAMEIAGYQTEVATNGAEALDLLRRHNADLCIVDINMPTMDGFEFLAKLREHDTQTPVLMLSARDSPVDVAKGDIDAAQAWAVNQAVAERALAESRVAKVPYLTSITVDGSLDDWDDSLFQTVHEVRDDRKERQLVSTVLRRG